MKRIKTNSVDDTKSKDIRRALRKELTNIHYINKVAVDIYGKIEYLTKDEVRALQIVAAKLASSDKEAFEDFKENVIVYSGRDITHSSHVVYWADKGCFEESFEKGFDSSHYLLQLLYDASKKK